MKKFKNILLAATVFFAFGTVASAKEFSFEQVKLTDKTGISGFKTSYIDTASSELWGVTDNNKYFSFVLKGDAKVNSYTCSKDERQHNIVYVDLEGNVYSECGFSSGSSQKKAEYSVNASGTTFSVTKTEGRDSSSKNLAASGYTYEAELSYINKYYNSEATQMYVIARTKNGNTSYAVSTAELLYEGKYLVEFQDEYVYNGVITGANCIVLKASDTFKIISGEGQIENISKKITIDGKGYDIHNIWAYSISKTKTYYSISTSYDPNRYYAEISDGKFNILKSSTGNKVIAKTDDEIISMNGEMYIKRGDVLYKKDLTKLTSEDVKTEYVGGILISYKDAKYTFQNGTDTLKTLKTSELGHKDAKIQSLKNIGDYYYFVSYLDPNANVPSSLEFTPSLYKMTVGETTEKDVSIKLDASEKTITVTGTTKLTATVDGTKNKVAWSSSNDKIATVDENGNVTGVAIGKATITATVDGKSVSATITVNAKTDNGSGNNSGSGSGSGSNVEVDNPHTGAAISVVGLAVLAGAGIAINKKKGKKIFHKI